MKTRIIRVQDISKEDEEAWRRLSESAVEPNPFVGPDFLLVSSRCLAGYADARLVVAHEGTEFRGVLPLSQIGRSRMPPRPVASVRSYPRIVTLLDTPLLDRSNTDEVSDALLGTLHQAAKAKECPGIVLFNQIRADGPVVESLRRVGREGKCPIFVKDSWERASVTRAGRWEHPVEGKRGREIARRQRSLEKTVGAEVTLVDRTSDPAAADDFLEMEVSGWKGKEGGSALARNPDMATWFKEWHRRSLESSRLHVLALNAGSRSVAMQYFVRCGEGLFCFRIAFDETYAKFSPGSILLVSALNHLRDTTDAAWIDSGTDVNNSFFLGIMPERRAMATLLIGTGGALDRFLVSELPAMTRVVAAGGELRNRLVRTRPE